MQKPSKYGKNDKNQQNGSSLCTHCSAVFGDILIVKVVLELYRPEEKYSEVVNLLAQSWLLWIFWKTVKKFEKNDKIQQNGSSLYTHCSAVYGDILIVKVVLELYRPGEKYSEAVNLLAQSWL